METKVCPTCTVEKPSDQFYVTARNGNLSAYCKPCQSRINREAYWSAPEHHRSRRERNRTQEKSRSSYLKRTYGITLQDETDLWTAQASKCGICLRPLSYGRHAHIDHDHVTGHIRGVLCGSCNRALGLFQDSPDVIDAASAYLRAHLLSVLNGQQ